MPPKVIQKSFTYIIPEPKELFDAFKDKFTKTKLPDSWNSSVQWTSTILSIFAEIGRNIGYKPKKEYLRLDQTWEIRHTDTSTIILALESENTDNLDEILNDELQKLIDIKAFLKVLVWYPVVPVMMQTEDIEGQIQTELSTYPEIQEKIQSAQFKNPEEKYIIITPVFVKDSSVIEVSSCSFDSEGKGQDLGDFQVKYDSKD